MPSRKPRQQDDYLSLSGEQRRKLTDKLLQVYGWKCWRCKLSITSREDATTGHIIDRAAGGPTNMENCRPEHSWCNYGARPSGPAEDAAPGTSRTRSGLVEHDGLGFFWHD